MRRLIASIDETRPETIASFEGALRPILESRPARTTPTAPEPAPVAELASPARPG